MTEVSLAMLIIQGLVGPKPRPKGVGDGQQVNIPVLNVFRYQLRSHRIGEVRVPIGRHVSSKVEQFGKSGCLFPSSGG